MIEASLIILPGWGGSHESWEDFVVLAKEKFHQVKVIDLPCFSSQPCPDKIWGIEEYAGFVKKKLENYSDQKIILLGHSFGGAVATQLAVDSPDLVDKLVLAGASVFRPEDTPRRIIFKLIAKMGSIIFKLPIIEKFDIVAKKLLYRAANSPDYLTTTGIKREIFKKIIRQDLSHLLPLVKMRTLVIWGSEDRYIPLEYGRKLSRMIPDSKLIIFQGGKHGLHLQQPKELLNKIIEFII